MSVIIWSDNLTLLLMKYLAKRITDIIFLLFTLSFLSCTYDPPERFTEVNSESAPPDYLLSQTIDFEKDTLFALDKTRFNFSFISSDQGIMAVTFNYLGKDLAFENGSGSFEVDPAGFQDGSYELICNVYVHSGTGSLADNLGAEGYVYTKKFVLIIERPGSTNIGFTHTTVENGFLRIHWKKFDRSYFDSYKISVSDSALNHYFEKTIYDADETYLVDSSFVGGSVKFRLLVTCTNGEGSKINFGSDEFIYRYPVRLSFIEKADSLMLKWTEIPFNHTIYYSSNYSPNPINLGLISSYKITNPGLGDPIQYLISVAPVMKLTWDHQRYNMYGLFSAGINSGLVFSRMSYSPGLDAFFTKDQMHVRKYNGNSLLLTGFYDYSWDYHDKNSLALSLDNSKLFSIENGNLLQLNSSTLELIKKSIVAPNASGIKRTLFIHILNDSMMYLSFNSWLTLYDYISETIIDQEAIESSPVDPYYLTVSKDGMFAANCGNGKLKVYRNNNNSSLDLIYETSGNFLECVFDPADIHNLLVVTDTDSYVLSCPGMETVYTIPESVKGYPVNFDPVTNYILFVSHRYNSLTVYDYKTGQVKFKRSHHGYYDEFYLGKNRIFHSGGYNIIID